MSSGTTVAHFCFGFKHEFIIVKLFAECRKSNFMHLKKHGLGDILHFQIIKKLKTTSSLKTRRYTNDSTKFHDFSMHDFF